MDDIKNWTDEAIFASSTRFVDDVIDKDQLPQMKFTNHGNDNAFSSDIFENTVKMFIDD